jgi:[NiFe] hydrogenase assembly HybE family chaperone
MTDAAVLLPDPAPQLEAGYRAAHARMQGLPFVNAALRVEAVAFAPWQDRWLGVLVTPWCMNLVLAPRDRRAWASLAIGGERRYAFPAGDYVFIGAGDEIVGEHQICSLFSPMLQFDDHDTARLVATLAREALFDPAHAAVHVVPAGTPSTAPESTEPGPIAQLQGNLEAPLSKRDFLRARFLGGDRGDRG